VFPTNCNPAKQETVNILQPKEEPRN